MYPQVMISFNADQNHAPCLAELDLNSTVTIYTLNIILQGSNVR